MTERRAMRVSRVVFATAVLYICDTVMCELNQPMRGCCFFKRPSFFAELIERRTRLAQWHLWQNYERRPIEKQIGEAGCWLLNRKSSLFLAASRN